MTATALMKTAEVAKLFQVNPRTVTAWAAAGKLPCIRTLGGHRRFDRATIERLAANGYETDRHGAA